MQPVKSYQIGASFIDALIGGATSYLFAKITNIKVFNSLPKTEFNTVSAYKNAITAVGNSKLTSARIAVTKHPQYFGFKSLEELQKVFRSPGAINELAAHRLKDVISYRSKITGAGCHYPNGWVTYTLG